MLGDGEGESAPFTIDGTFAGRNGQIHSGVTVLCSIKYFS